MAAEAPRRPVVFISHAWTDFDIIVAEKLYAYLKVLPEEVEIFFDRRTLEAGDRLTPKILDALQRAIVAITILSIDYFDPDRYTARIELPAIVRAEAAGRLTVIPIVSRALPLEEFAFFEDRLAANRISEPLSLFGVGDHRMDQVLLGVFRTVRKIVAETIVSPKFISTQHDLDQRPENRPVLPGAGQGGPVHGAPPLPHRYFDRKETQEIRQQVFDNRILGIAGGNDAYGVFGEGGIGKTVIASAIVWDLGVRRRFPDGIFWLTVGEGTPALTVQADLCQKLDVTIGFQNSLDGRKFLRSLLADRRLLVVLDDVWSAAQLEDLVVTGPLSRTLVTTRSDQRVLRPFGLRSFRISRLDTNEAVDFLRGFVSSQTAVPDGKLAEIAEHSLGVPLALALVGAAVRFGQDPNQVIARLQSDEFGDHPYAGQFKAHRIAADALRSQGEASLQRYHSLAVFPPDVVIPADVIYTLWSHQYPSVATLDAAAELARSDELGLLKIIRDDGVERVSLHDLNHAFVRLEVDSTLMSLHGALLESYRERLGNGRNWWELDEHETYLWNHLTYHLEGAGEPISSVVLDPRFIVKKLMYVGFPGLSADYKLALEQDERRTESLNTALASIRASEYLLKGLLSVESCAATFALYWSLGNRIQLKDLTRRLYVPLVDMAPGSSQLVRTLQAHAEPVLSVDWSPDGRFVASGSSDHTIKIWRHETGELVEHIEAHRRPIHGLRWAPNGLLLAAVSGDLVGVDDCLCIWDLTHEVRLISRAEHPTRVTTVAWSPNGRHVATGCEDSIVRLWTIGGVQQSVLSADGDRGPVRDVSWSYDGRALAAVFDNGSSIVWDAETFEKIGFGNDQPVVASSVCWSPETDTLVLGGPERLVAIYDSVLGDGGSLVRLNGAQTNINTVAWSGRGVIAAAGGNLIDANGSIWFWDAPSRAPVGRFVGHTDRVNDIAWSPDGFDLVSGSHDGTARIWSTRELHDDDRRPGRDRVEPVSTLRVSAGGEFIAVALGDFTSNRLYVEIFHTDSLELKSTMSSPHDGPIASIRWAPHEARFASGAVDGSVYLTDVGTGSDGVPTLLTVGDRVRAMEWSRDGDAILVSRAAQSIFGENVIDVLDAQNGTRLEAHPLATGSIVNALEFNPHGDLLALGYGDLSGRSSRVEILSYPAFRLVSAYDQWRERITGLSWSSHGDRLAVVCVDGTLRVIDLDHDRIMLAADAHGAAAVDVTWCDNLVVTVGNDCRVQIWSDPGGDCRPIGLGLVEQPVAVQQVPGSRSFVLASRHMLDIVSEVLDSA